jgi:hypothetical protein
LTFSIHIKNPLRIIAAAAFPATKHVSTIYAFTSYKTVQQTYQQLIAGKKIDQDDKNCTNRFRVTVQS